MANEIRTEKFGTHERKVFSRSKKEVLPLPNLVEVQKSSYKNFDFLFAKLLRFSNDYVIFKSHYCPRNPYHFLGKNTRIFWGKLRQML